MTQFWRMEAYGDGVDEENHCVTCPWCGEILDYELDSMGDVSDEDDEEIDCDECKKPVMLRTWVSVTHATYKSHQVRDVGRETTERILVFDSLERFLQAAVAIGNPVPF